MVLVIVELTSLVIVTVDGAAVVGDEPPEPPVPVPTCPVPEVPGGRTPVPVCLGGTTPVPVPLLPPVGGSTPPVL